jgi:hypothetical protein
MYDIFDSHVTYCLSIAALVDVKHCGVGRAVTGKINSRDTAKSLNQLLLRKTIKLTRLLVRCFVKKAFLYFSIKLDTVSIASLQGYKPIAHLRRNNGEPKR